MASLDSEEVKRALKSKLGCTEEVGHDHIRYVLKVEGRVVSRTKISHGARHALGDTLINKMTHQIKLGTNANFIALVQCTKTGEECLSVILAATR